MSARRRRRGDGSVFEYRTVSGLRFRIERLVPINPDDPDAGTKRKTQAGFTTKGEAAKALRAAVTEVETGRAHPRHEGDCVPVRRRLARRTPGIDVDGRALPPLRAPAHRPARRVRAAGGPASTVMHA